MQIHSTKKDNANKNLVLGGQCGCLLVKQSNTICIIEITIINMYNKIPQMIQNTQTTDLLMCQCEAQVTD
jgi:hypothetical protein